MHSICIDHVEPKVFIILLNWNRKDDTSACVDALFGLTYSNFQIVLVDNCSTDGSENYLRLNFPSLVLLQTGKNLGYAGGNNVGIKYALDHGADYVWLLNNDTVVHPESLSHMISLALTDHTIGMVGSKIFFYDEPNILWFAGGRFKLDLGGIASHIGGGQIDEGQYDQITDVEYVTGCSLLVKKAVIEKIGFLPEEYFLYFEETDWNYAAQKAGFRTVIAQKSIVWHKVKRQGKAHFRYLYYMTRNRFLIVTKLDRRYLRKCIAYQYHEGKELLKNTLNEKKYIKLISFSIILILAWLDGLILKRNGKVI